MGVLTSLQALDLSRNNIANLAPGTFLGLRQLRFLDIGVNALRTVRIYFIKLTKMYDFNMNRFDDIYRWKTTRSKA